jgi:cyclin B
MKNNKRSFGNNLQNVFNFLNNPNNIKKQNSKKQLENSSKVIKKAQSFQNNPFKRNTMYMKLSYMPIPFLKNNPKNNSNLFVIKEENIPSTRLTVLPNDANAITKGALIKNKIKEKEENNSPKDYFHLLLDDYGEDIFNHIKKNEKINIYNYSSKDLFKLQDKKYFNEKNRGIIFNWLVRNNHKWKLKDDTLFMAMNIMDRYISKYKVPNSEFQLVGVSSYLIASKYEDIYPPNVDELSQICNFTYAEDAILKKEYEILVGLNFDILYNSSYKYLTFMHSITDKENTKLFYISQFILELSLENLDILQYSQSKRALAALLIAKKILQIKKSWNELRLYYDYDENEIKNVQKKMIVLLKKVLNSKTKNSIYDKFDSSKYKCVSSFLSDMCQNKSNYKYRNDDDKENKENKENYNDENQPDNY